MKLAIVFAGHAGDFAHIDLVPVDRVEEFERDGIVKRWRGSVYYRTPAGRKAELGAFASYRNHVLVGWGSLVRILKDAGYQVTPPPAS